MELELIPRNQTRLNKKERNHFRDQGLVPAAVFGGSINAGPCFVNYKHSHNWHRGSRFDVTWNGKKYKASIDELQHSPVNNKLLHVSFHLVGKDEVTNIEVPIHTIGQAAGEEEGGMVHLQLDTIVIEGKSDDIPDHIEVDVSELNIGDKITVADLKVPANCKWYQQDEEQAIVTCAHIKVESVPEPEEVELTPEDAPVEAEGEASQSEESSDSDSDDEAA